MLFWNSNTNNSDIIAALNQLAASLGNINIDMPRFSDTILNSISISEETITKIVSREQKSRRTTLKVLPNSTASHVVILHGVKEPSLEEVLKSPWDLKPGEIGKDDLDGGYEIWAYAVGGTANLQIALEYEGKEQNQDDNNQNNIMEIQPFFGTGVNWENSNNPDWTYGYESELNSSISGFKLFNFSSFNPGQEYTLTINPGALAYQFVSHPINIYLFNLDSISKAIFWKIANINVNLDGIRGQIMPILKSSSWAARLPATGGDFILKPSHHRSIGLIDVRLNGETYAKTAIFNYQQGQETGTFTLVGP